MPLRWRPGKASRLALCARATEKERERRKSRKTLEIDETKKGKKLKFSMKPGLRRLLGPDAIVGLGLVRDLLLP